MASLILAAVTAAVLQSDMTSATQSVNQYRATIAQGSGTTTTYLVRITSLQNSIRAWDDQATRPKMILHRAEQDFQSLVDQP